MNERENTMTTRNKIIYWIATLWLASGMLSSGILQLFRARVEGHLSPPGVYGITHLGYPVYFLTILGIWKILGMTALLVPRRPLLKEWAYAGFFFVTTGAIFSHVAAGDAMKESFPATLLLLMTLLSWQFRAADRKLAAVIPSSMKQRLEPLPAAATSHGNHAAVA
jgi:uncharacterized membrane protein YphA (DoxX/SURF4 family)